MRRLHHIKNAVLLLWLLLPCFPSLAQKKSDSLAYLSRLSKATHDTVRIKLLNEWGEKKIYINQQEGMQHLRQALHLADSIQWPEGTADAQSAIGRIFWRTGEFDSALVYHFSALDIYRRLGQKEDEAITLMFIGQDYTDAARYPEATHWFNQSLKVYIELNDRRQIAGIYTLIALVETNKGNIIEAQQAYYEALKIYEELNDRIGIALSYSNMASGFIQLGNHELAEKNLLKAIAIDNKLDNDINRSINYILLGQLRVKQQQNDLALAILDTALSIARSISDTVTIAYALANLSDVYIRKGLYQQAIDSLQAAAGLYWSVNNKQELTHVLANLAICYARTGRQEKADSVLSLQQALTGQLGSLVSRISYFQAIEILDSTGNRWASAFQNLKRYVAASDSLFGAENSERLVQLQMTYDSEKKELAELAEQEKKDFRERNIRNVVAAGFAGVLVFLAIVYRQRNKISKEKKRSDHLLLNILPVETAKELKATGSAAARSYDKVTVMFTDFKDFTRASEWMTAGELVHEINYLFSEFDHIISRYKIEKIKTIGDSYMCAGGLPVVNHTNAADVVRAALDIQEFMLKYKNDRETENRHAFEIRIGIHTGPVVAGIVGIKKFAYDIWGDTVNLAARMESSGAEGMVNISGTTFEEVKDLFPCLYRGKISARNKGEVDMYFVGVPPAVYRNTQTATVSS